MQRIEWFEPIEGTIPSEIIHDEANYTEETGFAAFADCSDNAPQILASWTDSGLHETIQRRCDSRPDETIRECGSESLDHDNIVSLPSLLDAKEQCHPN
jgi:hypothetical protein